LDVKYSFCVYPGIAQHPYDEEFKKYHQLSLSILKKLGDGNIVMETRIILEFEEFTRHVKTLNTQPFDPKEKIVFAIQSVMNRITFGEPVNRSKKADVRIAEQLAKVPDQFLSLLVLDVLPILRFLPFFQNYLNNTMACTNELYELFDKKIDNIISQDASDETFVSCFIEKEGEEFDRTQLKGTLRDLVLAGTETVSSTILWTIVLLANNRDVQERIQKGIDSFVPRDRLPSLSDMSKMTYVEATILEIMRYKTVLPLGVPRATLNDTQVGGFFSPKKAHVSICISATICTSVVICISASICISVSRCVSVSIYICK